MYALMFTLFLYGVDRSQLQATGQLKRGWCGTIMFLFMSLQTNPWSYTFVLIKGGKLYIVL
jgi:hypothetical protein